MGATQSTTVVNSLTKSITNIAMNSLQNCTDMVTQEQNLTINNSGFKLFGNYDVSQASVVKSECFADLNKQTDIQNKIVDAISQATTSTGQGILGAFGYTSSEARANLQNIVKNNITMSNIQDSYNAISQKQTVTTNNSGFVLSESIDLTQGAQIFAAATMQEVYKAGIMANITKYVDQTSGAETKSPFAFITDLLSNWWMIMIVFIVIVMIGTVGSYLAYKYLFSGDTANTATESTPVYDPTVDTSGDNVL